MGSIEQARALLPWWVSWGPLLYHPVTCLIASWLAARLAVAIALRPMRAFAGEGWAERARVIHAARMVAGVGAVLFPGLAVVCASRYAGPLFPLGTGPLALLSAAAAFVPAFFANRRVDRAAGLPSLSLAASLRSVASVSLI